MNPEQIPIRDLHLPGSVGWWPLAAGWWILLAIVLLLCLLMAYRQWRVWRKNALRRLALRRLAQLQDTYHQSNNVLDAATAVSTLLRRGMLAYAPRAEIAGLTGQRWLQWLDQGMAQQPFTQGAGQLLQSIPYRNPESLGEVDMDALFAVVRQRLETPLGGGLS